MKLRQPKTRSAFDGAPHDCAAAADSSSCSSASCSASSRPAAAAAARRDASPDESGLEAAEPPALDWLVVAEEEAAWLGGAGARAPEEPLPSARSDIVGVDLRLRDEDEPPRALRHEGDTRAGEGARAR